MEVNIIVDTSTIDVESIWMNKSKLVVYTSFIGLSKLQKGGYMIQGCAIHCASPPLFAYPSYATFIKTSRNPSSQSSIMGDDALQISSKSSNQSVLIHQVTDVKTKEERMDVRGQPCGWGYLETCYSERSNQNRQTPLTLQSEREICRKFECKSVRKEGWLASVSNRREEKGEIEVNAVRCMNVVSNITSGK